MKSILLVFSGGLDTSVCIPLLREAYGFDRIITLTVDVGQPEIDIVRASEKARLLKTEHYLLDAKDEFAQKYCFSSIKANGLYENYPLSTALSRPVIGAKAIELAKRLDIFNFAHGCTGKGNDQFRIEHAIRTLCPEAEIIAPIREKNLTRGWELTFAAERQIPISQSSENIWSVDENLWGRSIEGGRLEDPDFSPPEEIFEWTRAHDLKEPCLDLEIEFDKGEPISLNGGRLTPVHLIQTCNRLAGNYGIGRIDILEDRLLGLKVRENYECPAALVLLGAHRALESLVLTRDEIRVKNMLEAEWSQLVYSGLWFDPLREALEAFILKTQERVSGTVRTRLTHGAFRIIGRTSPWALYSYDLASFESQKYDQKENTGTVKNHGLQARIYNSLCLGKGTRK